MALTLRKQARPHGQGRGFGRTAGTYAVLVDGHERGTIEGVDRYSWWLRLAGHQHVTLCASRQEAVSKAERLLGTTHYAEDGKSALK